MSLHLITAPAAEPLDLNEVKLHCRVTGTDDDTLLGTYIAAARAQAESITGRRLITQTWDQVLDAFPTGDGAIRLQVPPVQSISSVTYVDAAGATQTLSSAAYVLDADLTPGWLLLAAGQTGWPDTDGNANAVRVRMVSGYGAAGSNVPANLRAWMLLTVGALYAQREALDLAGRATALPGRFWDGLLDEHIVYAI